MISHASKALFTKISKNAVLTRARTLSSMSWPSPSYSGEITFQPVSSLQEALYPSDLSSLSTEEAVDPRSYGYRVVYPSAVSVEASLYDDDAEYLGTRAFESQSNDYDSYYNASFRPQVVGERPMVALTAAEKAAVMDSHQDWDAQLLEEEIMRFVAAD